MWLRECPTLKRALRSYWIGAKLKTCQGEYAETGGRSPILPCMRIPIVEVLSLLIASRPLRLSLEDNGCNRVVILMGERYVTCVDFENLKNFFRFSVER